MRQIDRLAFTMAIALASSTMASDGFAQQTGTAAQPQPTRSQPASDRATEAELREVLAKLQDEPTIGEVQKAALDFYNLSNKKIDGMKGRAASKALMPKVSAEVRRNALDVAVDKFDFIQFPDRRAAQDLITGDLTEIKGVATWDLPKVIYNPEVLDVYSLKRYREQIMKEVTRLFFLRRRIQIDFMLNPPADPQTFIVKKLRVEEVTAMLDAMTGGIYSSQEE